MRWLLFFLIFSTLSLSNLTIAQSECVTDPDSPFRLGAQIVTNGVNNWLDNVPGNPTFQENYYQPDQTFLVISEMECVNRIPYWLVTNGQVTGWLREFVEDARTAEVAMMPDLDLQAFTYDDRDIFEIYAFSWGNTDEVGENYLIDILPAFTGQGGYYPPERRIVFLNYLDRRPENYSSTLRAQMSIFPARPYLRGVHADNLYKLQAIWNGEVFPETYSALEFFFNSEEDQEARLPYIPSIGAAMAYGTQVRGLEFENGFGIRYITEFAQDFVLPKNSRMIYTFQGVTYDGNWYVSLRIPIDANVFTLNADLERVTSNVPPPDFDEYTQLYNDLLTILDAQNPTDFTPSLTQLDNFVLSLFVGEFGEVNPDITHQCDGNIPPSRLSVGQRAFNINDDDFVLNVRQSPNLSGEIITQLESYQTLEVIGDVVCADGYAWWQIQVGDIQGWAAEAGFDANGRFDYWLEPLLD